MTIETLLESAPEELEKMSDDQLREFFAPYLVFVRPPEQQLQVTQKSTMHSVSVGNVNQNTRKRKPNLDSQMELLEELARKKGLL